MVISRGEVGESTTIYLYEWDCNSSVDHNAYTTTVDGGAAGRAAIRFAYCLSSGGAVSQLDSSFDYTSDCRVTTIAVSFTVDGGDTVSKFDEDSEAVAYEGSSGAISTPADATSSEGDSVVIGGTSHSTDPTWTDPEIPSGTGATQLTAGDDHCAMWYQLYTTNQSNLEAEIDHTAAVWRVIQVVVFKSEATGGVGIIPMVYNYTYRKK